MIDLTQIKNKFPFKEFENGIFINGDCLEVMKFIQDKSIDLVITSPPYNFSKGTGMKAKYTNYKDNLTYEQYFKFQSNCIKEFIRISKLSFYNIQFIAGNSLAFCQLIGKFAKDIKEFIIWDKIFSEPAINENVLNSEFEFIIVFEKNTKGRKFDETNFNRGTLPNIFRINKIHNWKSAKNGDFTFNKINKSVFPLEFPEKILKNFSFNNQIILDAFSGSGTTAIACYNLNRNFICIELDKEYFEKSIIRYEKHIIQERIEFSKAV